MDDSSTIESSKSLSDTSHVSILNQQLNSPNVTPLTTSMTALVTSTVTKMVTSQSAIKTTAPQVAPIPDKILDEFKPVDNFFIGKASTHSTTPKSTVPPTTPPPSTAPQATITTINQTASPNITSTEIEPPSKTPRKDFDRLYHSEPSSSKK